MLAAPRFTRYSLFVLTSIAALSILYTSFGGTWHDRVKIKPPTDSILAQELQSLEQQHQSQRPTNLSPPTFKPGIPIAGYNYTRKIVVGKKKKDDISWLYEQLPDVPKAVYVVDDPRAPLHPPKNKGNEAMVYLSYITDHYDDLPDISIFVHAHRYAWHNNDLLDADSAKMVARLSTPRVVREGYVNLRCQWYPGCPGWLHPNARQEDEEKKEEMYIAQAWGEIFPDVAMPEVLGQPCCSQFALSRDRIRSVRLDVYKRLQKWLLDTKVKTSMSGRVFEYTWQFLWTGEAVLCTSIHTCYCDGYGACFEDEEAFQDWFRIRFNLRSWEWELEGWQDNERKYEDFVRRGRKAHAERVERAPEGRIEELKFVVDQNWIELDRKREEAFERGKDSKARAKIAGREWKEGDGL